MTYHIDDIRAYMMLTENLSVSQYAAPMHEPEPIQEEPMQAPEVQAILEALELARFKLLNHRQMEGSGDYALGYEEACTKVAEMIDGIIRNHR